MVTPRFLFPAFLAVATALHAGEPPLTNNDIVKMAAAGLSAETIVAKIQASRVDFRTDTDSLVALASARVPDAVIKAMIQRQAKPAAAKPNPASARKRFAVNIQKEGGGRCTQAELTLTTTQLHLAGCREEVLANWSGIENVCYVFGFRGTLVMHLPGGEHRITTTTPAEMKAIRDAIRSRSPKTVEVTGCK